MLVFCCILQIEVNEIGFQEPTNTSVENFERVRSFDNENAFSSKQWKTYPLRSNFLTDI